MGYRLFVYLHTMRGEISTISTEFSPPYGLFLVVWEIYHYVTFPFAGVSSPQYFYFSHEC